MRNSWWGILLLILIFGLLYLLDAVLMPFIAGIILAYLADPLTNHFQRWGMNRAVAVSSVFCVLLLVLVVSLLIIIPLVIQQLKQLSEAIPGIFAWGENTLAPQVFEWTGYDLRSELVNVRETLVENWRD
ncbi:MAG: AI-2E family transporter, partial [Halomonas sp.]